MIINGGDPITSGTWLSDPYDSQLDWSPATKKNPLPKWYKQILKKSKVCGELKISITMGNAKAPLILRLEIDGNVVSKDKEKGWVSVLSYFHIPRGVYYYRVI